MRTREDQAAIELVKKLRLLVDIRKRNAFDFLTSVHDMGLYGVEHEPMRFNEQNFQFEQSETTRSFQETNWEERDSTIERFNSDDNEGNLFHNPI